MRVKTTAWMVVIGALFLALPYAVRNAYAAGACYLTAHGDVQCPADPDAPGGRPGSGDVGDPGWIYHPEPSIPIIGISSCNSQNPLDVFREHARAREGYSLTVYLDSLGKPTVGIGHLVTPEDDLDVGDEISPERVQEFWLKDSMAAFTASVEQAKAAGICDPCFIAALASVNYQMGTNWTAKFPVVWAMIMAGEYNAAADRLDTSKWMEQTPVRVRDFQMALRALPPKPPACVLNPPIVLPPKLCDIVPEMCEPICYGDLCHCKMEPIPGGGPAPTAAPAEADTALPVAAPAASVAPTAASTAQCYDPTSCQVDVTPGNFMSELNGKPCGCTLKMASGNYPTFTYTKNCTADNPFILEAQEMGKPTFGGFRVNGNGLIVNGTTITNGVTINGDYNRITRSLLLGNGSLEFIEGSAFNRFDHNDLILPINGGGHGNTAISFYRPRSIAQMYNNNRIDSNYFTTNTPTASAAHPGMGIFLCMYGAEEGYPYLSQFGSARTLIENNLFENWGRKDTMEVKCSDNVFRNNTLNTTGRILSRHGYHNQYLNNYMQNVNEGIAIREYQQQIIGNYMTGGGSFILYGGTRKYPDGACYQPRAWMPSRYPGAPQGPPAVGTFLDKNRGPLLIGKTQGSGCNVPVLDTTIACHEGPITKTNYDGLTGPTSTSCGFTMPHKLTRAEVGRGGPEGSCEVPVIPGGPVCTPVDGGDPPGEPEPLGPGIKLCYPSEGNEKPACGEAAFRNALASAQPGDHIQLCAGNYGGAYTYSKNGTEAAPIVIEPQAGDNVVITGTFNMDGTYGVLTGMSFTGGGRINLDGEYNRVTKNRFHDFAIDGVISMSGNRHSHNRIDHNDFRNFRGGAIRADGIHSNGATALNHQGHRVDSNYFTNHSPLGINESVFLILTDSFNDMNLTYENNVFDNVLNNLSGQKELMSVKTARTVVRGNTIMNSGDVTISIRESNRSIVENNCLKDGALIRVHGDDNIIRNNRLEGGKIEVRGGDCTMDCKQCDLGNKYTATIMVGSDCRSAHTAARHAVVENNIGRITVGDHFPGDNVPAQDNTIRNNSGPVQLMNETLTTVTNGAPINTAVCLAPNQVGSLVDDTECPDN